MNSLFRVLLALVCATVLSTALTGCFGREELPDATPIPTTDAAAFTEAAPTAPTTKAPAYPFTGYINASTLHVRPSAGTDGYAIGGLTFGDTVTVTGREGDWYQIAFGDKVGYVNAQYVQDTLPVSTTAPADTTAAPSDTTAAADATTSAASDTTTAPEVVAP